MESREAAGDQTPGGRIPGSIQMLGRIIRVFLVAFGVMIALTIVWFLSGVLDSPILRVLVGAVLFLVVASLGIGYFRQVGNPPPPDPEPMAVHPGLRLAYVCDMCGLELAVLKVAKERAPKHCGETMTLVQRPAETDD
ncbi:MAG TPA: hypothetical protein VN986_02600 [Actinomycetota bacterium]|nr:hypothetical protein [Actinomycetota bacterium]